MVVEGQDQGGDLGAGGARAGGAAAHHDTLTLPLQSRAWTLTKLSANDGLQALRPHLIFYCHSFRVDRVIFTVNFSIGF